MRIAVCFSGQIRTGIESSVSIKRYLGKYFNDIDFFIHTWNQETESPHAIEEQGLLWNKENIIKSLTPIIVDDKKFTKIKEIYSPISMVIDDFDLYQEKRKNHNKENDLLGYSNPVFQTAFEGNTLRKKHEESNRIKYDLVIKMRYDQIFDINSSLEQEINFLNLDSNTLYVCDHKNKLPDAIEDIMWISNPNVMDIVCDFVFEIEKRVPSRYDGEFINGYNISGYIWQMWLKEYLIKMNISFKPFKNNKMSILRNFHIENNYIPYDNHNLI